MDINLHKVGFGFLALSLFLGACVHTRESEKLYDPTAATSGTAAVLWSVGSRRDSFRERTNYAIVTKVNDTGIGDHNPPTPTPIELLAGPYNVKIRYEKDLFMWDFGSVLNTQSTKSVELPVEPGHSYSPQATRRCGKDWIWIEDWGMRVQNDISLWQEKGYYSYDFQEKNGTKRVVAGEAPPATCDVKQQ